MDVDAMDELMYDTLVRYFKTLAHTGYKNYDVVFKILIMDFIYEITHNELRYYITNKDIKLMQDLLYQFLGSTCEISFPTNNRPCCVCICPHDGSSTPPPIITPTTTPVPTTTTSTQPPKGPAYLILNSAVAKAAYVNYELVDMWTLIEVEVGSRVSIIAQDISGYTFKGFYKADVLIGSEKTLWYHIPSAGTNTIELRYEKEEESTTTTTTTVTPEVSTTTTSTQPMEIAYLLQLKSPTVISRIKGKFGNTVIDDDISDKTVTVYSPTPPSGIITDCISGNEYYRFSGIYDLDSGELLSASLPYNWVGNAKLEFRVYDATPTTSTTTSTSPTPAIGNDVYYGVVTDYMPPSDFVNLPISTLMQMGNTESKTVTGDTVNEFSIPQDGYYSYLIIPSSKVQLQSASFTSGGITTVLYDYTKENVAGKTENGAYYSKYTRGGVNANQGGTYNGINYDVYFTYNNAGGFPENINVKAKNK